MNTNISKQFLSTFLDHAVGFDPMWTANTVFQDVPGFPKYNIEKDGEKYTVKLAVAGFGKSNLDIDLEKSTLSITGKPETESKNVDFLTKGISSKGFNINFALTPDMQVESADLDNGILSINMKRQEDNSLKTHIDIA